MIEGTADMMKGTGTTIGIEVDMMIGTENGGMMIEIMIVIKEPETPDVPPGEESMPPGEEVLAEAEAPAATTEA